MKKLLQFLLAGALLFSLISCGSKKGTQKDNVGFPREKTLYLAGFQWGPPGTFNPLSDWPDFPVGAVHNIMYEKLLIYNTQTGELDPLLASLHEQTKDYISVIMNPEARWSDNTPLTAADVKFTYEIGKFHKSAPASYIWDFISDITIETDSASTDSGNSVKGEIVKFYVNKEKENNPIVVLDILQSIQIVPRHIFETKLKEMNGSFSEVQKLKMDKDPVVSGPYNLHIYTVDKIVLKRCENYWGNKALYQNRKPVPEYIIHPIFKSNDHFSTALQRGELDANSNFIPRIWMKFKSGVRTWHKEAPYFVPASIPMFTINVTRYPLSDKNFRRAMAFAINYNDIKELAMSGYSPDLKPGLILPFGNEKEYYSEEDGQKYGIAYDVERAKKILADAGYTSVFENGKLAYMKNAKGEKVPTVHLRSPAGWSDWESIVKIAVKSLRAAGIDAREGFCDESLYWQCQPSGDFDLLLYTPAAALTPSLPWARFQMVMSSRNWKPEGEKMNENQGRYNNPNSSDYNPRVDELLVQIPTLLDKEEMKKAYRELNMIFMQDLPALPVVYRPEEFYDYSNVHWTNFATEDNPYAPPQLPCFGAGRNMLWEIKLAEKGK